MIETLQRPLNAEQAAEYLGFTRGYLYKLVAQKKITCYRPGGKVLYFKTDDLERFIDHGKSVAGFELQDRADRILAGA